MIIALTGVPGTGKHSVASLFSRETGYNVVDVNKLLGSGGLTKEISPAELNKLVGLGLKDNSVIVSHMSHFLTSNKIGLFVVLRCRPDVLIKRLSKRGYSKEKIYDNVLFEAIDGEYIEACELHDKVMQIDNTSNLRKTVKKMKLAIAGKTVSDRVDYSKYIKTIEQIL